MALETATYISDLVVTNPTSSDAKAQGDDHLRLEKTTLKNTFPNVTGAVTATHTQLNSVLTNGTSVASTSGTTIDFTGIPSWVKRITVSFVDVSTNGTSGIGVQIGSGGGIESTGYSGGGGGASSSASFLAYNSAFAANIVAGSMQIVLADLATNTWVASGVFATGATQQTVAGAKALAGTLDRLRIYSLLVTTFDAGLVNIQYQ